MSTRAFKQFLISIHRWVGLTVGALMVVLGVSGSVAVVWPELTTLPGSEFRVESQRTDWAPLQKVMETLHAAQPERTDAWMVEWPYPEARHKPIWAIYEEPAERAHIYESPLYVAINPYTAEYMGHFYWGSTFSSWMYNLHHFLQIGEPGLAVVGYLGFGLLLLSISGLYLWWPLGRFTRYHFATIKGEKGPRLEFHLHKLFGFYSSLVLLMVSITAIILTWPAAAARVVGVVQPVNAPLIDFHVAPKVTPIEGVQPIAFDRVLEIAKERFPNAEFRGARMPSPGGTTAYGVVMYQPDGERFNRKYPESRIYVNQYSGEVMDVVDATKFNFTRSLISYNRYSFHMGEAFGIPGRVILFLSGFVPLFLYYSGIKQWLRTRRRAQKAALATESQ